MKLIGRLLCTAGAHKYETWEDLYGMRLASGRGRIEAHCKRGCGASTMIPFKQAKDA